MKKQRNLRRWLLMAAALTGIAGFALAISLLPGQADPLAGTIAAIKAKGEPWELTDLDMPAVKPEENAAIVATRAAEALKIAKEDGPVISSSLVNLPLSDECRVAADRIVKKNVQALADVARCQTLSQANWKSAGSSLDPTEQYKIRLGGLRSVSNILSLRALRAHEQSHDEEALVVVSNTMALARTMGNLPGCISMLVRLSIEQAAANTLHEITPDMLVNTAAEKERVRAMIASLLDESEIQRSTRWQILTERVLTYHMVNKTLGTIQERLAVRAYRAQLLAYIGEVIQARNYHQLLAVAYPDMAGYQVESTFSFNKGMATYVLTNIEYAPAVSKHLRLYFTVLANRRMSAVALALRLYAADHGGKRPATLDALVQEKYLPAVPEDPLSDSHAIQYLPDDARPRLYSVGADGQDDGGSIAKTNPKSRNREHCVDYVYFLTRPTAVDPENPMDPMKNE